MPFASIGRFMELLNLAVLPATEFQIGTISTCMIVMPLFPPRFIVEHVRSDQCRRLLLSQPCVSFSLVFRSARINGIQIKLHTA